MIPHAILWTLLAASSIEHQAFESVLRLLGYEVAQAQKPGAALLVVPAAEGITAAQADAIRQFIVDGGDAVIAGEASLASVLDTRPVAATIVLKDITDIAHPDRYLRWNPTETLRRFEIPDAATVLLQDQVTHQPLAFRGHLGKGRYLALATAFDTTSQLGTSRYPYFAEYLQKAFNYHPVMTRPRIEAYFDPAFRPNADIATLVANWRAWGIRTIYAATWYDFDYAHLIETCHANGIAVYAWFTPPMVTPAFWNDHPDWRATRTGWRYPMNLQIQEARRAAFAFITGMIARYDWDGVNLAEMNSDDPQHVNVAETTALHRDLLAALPRRDIEVIVTAVDSLHDPHVQEQTGLDSRAIARLMRKFPFTLQVEDPYQFWPQPPDRYRRFADTYRSLLRTRDHMMFDINVVADRDVTPTALPSALATGTEFLQLLHFAAEGNGRVAIYSESTIAPQDWAFAAVALAAGTRLSTEVNGVLVPAGYHLIPLAREASGIRLLAISGELLAMEATSSGMKFQYEAPGRCAVAFSKAPREILVDGKGHSGATLPRGRHSVEVK